MTDIVKKLYRLLNCRERRSFGWSAAIALDDGLKATYRGYPEKAQGPMSQVEVIGCG